MIKYILIFVGFIYLLTIPYSFGEGEDVMNFITAIKKAPFATLFHPNHLFFTSFNALVYYFMSWLHKPIEVSSIMIGINILCSLASLAITYLISKKLELSKFTRGFICFSIAFSYGYWIYTLIPDSYLCPLPFYLLTIYYFLNLSEDPCNKHTLSYMSICTIVGTLFHQQAVILPISIFAILIFLGFKEKNTSFFRAAGRYTLYSFVGIVGVYSFIGIYFNNSSNPMDIISWASGEYKHFYRSPVSLTSIIKSGIGMFKSIWGGNFFFYFTPLVNFIQNIFPNKSLVEEIQLAKVMNPWMTLIASYSLFLSLSSVIYLSFVSLKNLKPTFLTKKSFQILATFLLSQTCFIIWWEGYNIEFWIMAIPLLFLSFGFLLDRSSNERGTRRAMLVFGISLFICNLCGNIIPQKHEESDFWSTNMSSFTSQIKTDVILMGFPEDNHLANSRAYLSQQYFKQYCSSQLRMCKGLSPEKIISIVEEERSESNKVFISSWNFSFPTKTASEISNDPRFQEFTKLLSNRRLYLSPSLEMSEHTIWEVKKLEISEK
jgi:hypothetical protein